MGRASVGHAARALGATAATTCLAVALAGAAPERIAAAVAPRAAVETVVLAGVVALAALAAGALATGCWALAAASLARATGRRAAALDRTARALTPDVLRRVVAAGVGVGLGLGGAVTATATETDLGWQPTTSVVPTATVGTTGVGAVSTDTVPIRSAPASSPATGTATTPAAPAAPPGTATPPPSTAQPSGAADAPAAAETATVRPGDSLWSLAAARLAGRPTDAEIAAAWPRWYEANRDVVGPDPDLLLPGQVLTVPTTDGTAGAAPTDATTGADR